MHIVHLEGFPVLVHQLNEYDLQALQDHYLPIVSDIKEEDINYNFVKISKNRSQDFDESGLFEKFNKILKPYAEEYVKGFNFKFPYTLNIKTWYNVHAKYDHQQLHNHIVTEVPAFSSVCIIKQPNSNSGQLCFYTPSLSNHFKYLELDPYNDYPNIFEPEMYDGVLIFFPSCLEHFVTYNQTDELRVVFASNIIVKRND